jgi:hypothetical protein
MLSLKGNILEVVHTFFTLLPFSRQAAKAGHREKKDLARSKDGAVIVER